VEGRALTPRFDSPGDRDTQTRNPRTTKKPAKRLRRNVSAARYPSPDETGSIGQASVDDADDLAAVRQRVVAECERQGIPFEPSAELIARVVGLLGVEIKSNRARPRTSKGVA
jgi:hypothetical protein